MTICTPKVRYITSNCAGDYHIETDRQTSGEVEDATSLNLLKIIIQRICLYDTYVNLKCFLFIIIYTFCISLPHTIQIFLFIERYIRVNKWCLDILFAIGIQFIYNCGYTYKHNNVVGCCLFVSAAVPQMVMR